MKFSEQEIENLDITNVDDLIQLISKICGQELDCKKSSTHVNGTECPTCKHKNMLGALCKSACWNISTLNQALLLLNQATVSPGFYKYFFGDDETERNLKQGIVQFRGTAMLRFGNFRFAYKNLSQKNNQEISQELKQYSISPSGLETYFRKRGKALSLVKNIDRYKRWYLGYISGTWAEQDLFTLAALEIMLGGSEEEARKLFVTTERWKKFQERRNKLISVDPTAWKSKLSRLGREIDQIQKDIQASQELGLRNTYAYLSSECLDIYVATSMRESWEYEETSKFISQVFSQVQVKRLNPVYFDPTLSYSRNRIDKGLIEGLMLKRARCTLYMVQETDTLGKDSELASTLAQGKPVIAYVPKKSSLKLKQPLRNGVSLRFATKRLLLLMAELDLPQDARNVVLEFLLKSATFNPMFRLVGKEEQEFLNKHKTEWIKVKKVLKEAENEYFEKRASTLIRNHPLALQVNLESGVANGVLVVRSPRDCAQLLGNLLTNKCRFTIEHLEGIYILREYISNCPFRVVTDDPILTNSFWGFYGKDSINEIVSFIETCFTEDSDRVLER